MTIIKINKKKASRWKCDKKTVLITGGAGLIGSNLADYLLKMDCNVVVMDNLYSSTKRNILKNLGNMNFEFIRQDVNIPFTVEADEIYHLACPASPIHYQKDPVFTIKTSIYGALNVLENAKRTGARVLLASTSEIYGNPQIHPQREDYWGHVNPIGPRSCYDEGKRTAETLFFDYNREYNVDIVVVRIFNTYGPGMQVDDGRVISNFIMQALRDEDITVYGNGSQTRSFCYISDLVEGLFKAMNKAYFTGPVNLGNPEEASIKTIAEKIVNKTCSSSSIIYLPLPTDDPLRRQPDISLARKTLGWEPQIALENGISQTIDYFREFIGE